MYRRIASCLTVTTLLALMLLPSMSFAWFYNEYPEDTAPPADTNFEMFGPRCDRLLIKLYSTAEAEWDALKATPQELDLTDWPLNRPYYDQFIAPPYDAKVNVESVGGEFGIRCLDLNQNDNPYLGIPQNHSYVNPKHNLLDADPKNDHNPTSDVNMRKAILSCIDRSYYVANIIGSGFAVEHWAMLPPATGMQYYQETFKMYPYSPTNAANYLAGGKFKINPSTGWRYWDLNDNNVEDPDEWVELDFVIRNDDPHRNATGIHLANTLEAAPVQVRVQRNFMDITDAREKWMLGKNAHLYTAGWSLGIEPDSIVVWMGDAGLPHNPDGTSDYSYYWHPRTCYNTAYANDATFNINARIVKIANSEAEAIAAMAICNQRAADMALNGPMFVYSSTMANARKYVGGTPAEEDYVGRLWKGMVMVTGYGSDSYFGMLNMHPEGYPLPADGVIRYGFKTTDIRLFNTIYAEWVWDNKVLNLIYDSLVKSNPYNLNERIPWMVSNFTVGTYEHPTLGPCTKVRFTLRNDATWTDGVPITVEDVYFTLVELKDLLVARGLPNPWWYSSVKSILSFSIIDPLNFEILINEKSIWAIGLTSLSVRLMPEHIWRPIITSAPPSAVQGVAPDPNMIGSGPWRFKEYVASSHVLLVANKPGSTVQTSHPGSTPVTSPKGYFRYHPVIAEAKVDGTNQAKIDYYTQPHTIDFTVSNLYLGGSMIVNIYITYPNGSIYSEIGTVIASEGTWSHSWTGELKEKKTASIQVDIVAPSEFTGIYSSNCVYWATIKEDIVGSHCIDSSLLAPDIMVDIKDLATACKAFGSFPGHPSWSPNADINGDYTIDLHELLAIAIKFGWNV